MARVRMRLEKGETEVMALKLEEGETEVMARMMEVEVGRREDEAASGYSRVDVRRR